MIDKLIYNYLINLGNKEIDQFERAHIIRKYTKENKLSIRQFSKQFNLHHNTVQDWLLWDRLTKDEYEELKTQGLNKTEIYRILRDNNNKIIPPNAILFRIFQLLTRIRDSKDRDLINDIQNEIDRIKKYNGF